MNAISNIESEMAFTASESSKSGPRYQEERAALIATETRVPLQLRISRRGAREQRLACHNFDHAVKRLSKNTHFHGNLCVSLMQLSILDYLKQE